ncbi:MAG: hypothetical protein GC138_00995 [Gammaproteobacteria bacterium]|nr:hypothetical protein [Gammaproteobacteria bacterium]
MTEYNGEKWVNGAGEDLVHPSTRVSLPNTGKMKFPVAYGKTKSLEVVFRLAMPRTYGCPKCL